jgi:hypothetical protein
MTPERKQEILDMIRAAGFVRVEVEFSGGGDEGSYDQINGITEDGDEVEIQSYYSKPNDLGRIIEDETDNYWDWNGSSVSGKMLYDAENDEIVLNMDEEEWVTRPTVTF